MHHNHFPHASGIYLISDRRLCGGVEPLLQHLAAAIAAGCTAIQLRERDLGDLEYLALARQLCERKGAAKIILNRRFQLVRDSGADGVQIGCESLQSLRDIRAAMPPDSLIGASCHTEEDVRAAAEALVDFATVSPLFATESKPRAKLFLAIAEVASWQERYPIALYPLGGLGVRQASQLASAGIRRLACIRGVLGATDPVEAATKVRQLHYEMGL